MRPMGVPPSTIIAAHTLGTRARASHSPTTRRKTSVGLGSAGLSAGAAVSTGRAQAHECAHESALLSTLSTLPMRTLTNY